MGWFCVESARIDLTPGMFLESCFELWVVIGSYLRFLFSGCVMFVCAGSCLLCWVCGEIGRFGFLKWQVYAHKWT